MVKNFLIVVLLLACGALGSLLWWQSRTARGAGPAVAGTAQPSVGGDVRIVLPEAYLDRVIRDQLGRASDVIQDPRIDLLPGNQAQLLGRTSALGLSVPLQIDVRLSAVAGTVRADVTGVQAGPIALPSGIRRTIQTQVDAALSQAVTLEPTGFTITGVGTDDTAVTVGLTQR